MTQTELNKILDKHEAVQKKISMLAYSLGVTEVYLRKNSKTFNLHTKLQLQGLLRDKLGILESLRNAFLNDLLSKPIINVKSYLQLNKGVSK